MSLCNKSVFPGVLWQTVTTTVTVVAIIAAITATIPIQERNRFSPVLFIPKYSLYSVHFIGKFKSSRDFPGCIISLWKSPVLEAIIYFNVWRAGALLIKLLIKFSSKGIARIWTGYVLFYMVNGRERGAHSGLVAWFCSRVCSKLAFSFRLASSNQLVHGRQRREPSPPNSVCWIDAGDRPTTGSGLA